jgi:hypothetical protein
MTDFVLFGGYCNQLIYNGMNNRRLGIFLPNLIAYGKIFHRALA